MEDERTPEPAPSPALDELPRAERRFLRWLAEAGLRSWEAELARDQRRARAERLTHEERELVKALGRAWLRQRRRR